MTPSEFKAWFDGFTEAFDGSPSEAQWGRIKARVAEIDGKSVTERVYVDRYLPSLPAYPTYPYYPRGPYWGVAQGVGATNAVLHNSVAGTGFNSAVAMNSLGRIEAQGIA